MLCIQLLLWDIDVLLEPHCAHQRDGLLLRLVVGGETAGGLLRRHYGLYLISSCCIYIIVRAKLIL